MPIASLARSASCPVPRPPWATVHWGQMVEAGPATTHPGGGSPVFGPAQAEGLAFGGGRLAAAPHPGRAAGIKQAAKPERVLISGRQLLGITLTEWFCLPAFSTVRRPQAMDQRQGSGAQRTGRGCHADPAGSPLLPPTAPTPAQTQVLWAPRTCASPGCGPGTSELDRSQRD